jgi:putative DNA primase/helicase
MDDLADIFLTDGALPLGEDDAIPPEFSDENLALEFSRRHADALRYVAKWGRWMIWNGSRWAEDTTLKAFDLARVVSRGAAAECDKAKVAAAVASAKTVAAIEKLAKADRRHAATVEQWDADTALLATPEQTMTATTIRPNHPDDYCTKQTTVTPDLNADCPLWKKFLLRVMDGDPEMVDYLQRVCGYCLTGITSEHVVFFGWGTGANGKSTFANVLTSILGIGPSGYAAIAPISTFTASHTDQHPTDLAMLRGARLVIAQETEENRIWAISKIKMMTGGDPIAARFMRQDFFSYLPQFKVMIMGNHKPALQNVDEASRRRFHLIPFTVTVPGTERDPKLGEKLKAESPAILAWMIEGCAAWQRQGLTPPAKVRAASDAYFADEDTIGAWIAECCIISRGSDDTLNNLYPSWKAWAEARNERPGSAKDLAKALDARAGLTRRNEPVTKRAGWLGLKVMPPAAPHWADDR